MIRFALAALTLSAAVAQAGEVSLPAGFEGLYATEGMPCGGDLATRITVEGSSFIFMDAAMTVTDLIEFPGEPDKVELSLLVSGGGGEWTESAVMTLASDGAGQALVVDYPDGNRSIWERCGDLP